MIQREFGSVEIDCWCCDRRFEAQLVRVVDHTSGQRLMAFREVATGEEHLWTVDSADKRLDQFVREVGS